MRVAIVCEWLVGYAGSEKVLAEILQIYPEADLFAVVDFLNDEDRSNLKKKKASTTFIQKLPGARKNYRHYLPLMPLAIEQFDLSSYDLVISNSHAVAKGVLTGPDQMHVSYVHSPIRYAWDLQHQYLNESGLSRGLKSWVARWLLHKIRIWDYRTAAGVDFFVCNSDFISRRIAKVYGRPSDVIYPPVDVGGFTLHEAKQDFYLTASRLVPYKRVELIVDAFALMPNKKLIVIGDGPDLAKIRAKATSNIEVLGYQTFESLKSHMQRAKAFVFAAEEDFGIAPVEAQACGTPVIAYGKGGALETVVGTGDQSTRTGIFFSKQTTEELIAAVSSFEALDFSICPSVCRRNAERFSRQRFRDQFAQYIDRRYAEFSANA